MANSNEIQLVVTVEVDRANRSIKSLNANLSGIEAAAAKSASSASQSIDGITASMVKGTTAGNLFADAIQRALEFVKEWTVEATRYAARTETLGIVTHQLAKVNGYAAGFVDQLVDRVKALGITTQEAHGVVQRMIFAQLDLSKATELARVAQDAAVIAGTDSSEALENIILGITTGQTRLLHNMGIQVSLVRTEQEAEQKLGHSLSETERRAAMLDKVLTEGVKIRGTYAAAMETVGKQVTSLPRYFAEAKNALGAHFLPEMRAVVAGLKDLAGWVQNNADLLGKFGRVAVATAAMIATATLVSKIGAITTAVQGLTAALLANPWGLLAAGVVAAGGIIYKTWSDTQAGLERGYEEMRRKTIQKDLFHGKLKLDDVRKMGYTDDQIREIVTGRRLVPGESWPDFSGPKVTIAKGPSEDDLRRLAEERKRRADAERGALEDYLRAVEQRKAAEVEMTRARIDDSLKIIAATSSETEAAKESLNVVLLSRQEYAAGVEKIRQEEKRDIEQRSSYTDEKTGIVRHFRLSQAALESIHKATAEKIAAFDMRFNEEESRRIEAMLKAAAERSRRLFDQLFIEPMKQQLYVWAQTADAQDKIDDQARSARLAAVDQRKDLELAQLDAIDAVTIQNKIQLEQAKTAIEVRAIRERAAIEMEQIDAQTERQVAEARKAAMAQGIFYEPYLQQIESKIRELGQHEKDALQKAAASEVDVTHTKSAAATRKIVTDEYRSMFQTLKQEAGGVFDALVTKSQSVWSAIGNSLKTALLTAIKDVVTSRVAAMLMQLFVPGASVQVRQSGMGGGGMFGKLGGILGVGAVPVFGSPSAPGGTPPFLPSGSGGTASAPATAGGALSKAGLAGFLPNLKSFFGFGDETWVNMGGGRMATGGFIGQYGSFTDKLTALGKSNAALLASGMLLLNGLQRGGWVGMGEDVAGGALIGFKYGGPLGAAIGAAAGAVAGIVRMFVKGATDKAKEKIKALYGVDISDKSVLQQIVDAAKSAYGGNLDLAIRSPQIRDLIQLYAMTTGQKPRGMPGTVTPVSLVETGGSLFQSPAYQNGSPLPGLTGLPSLDQIGGGTMTNAGGTIVIPLQIDSQAVGNVVIQNGRVVTQGAITAMKSNAGRREMTALQLSPGTLVS